MSFFAVLLALVIEQLRPLPRDNSVHDALVAWTRWIGRNFDAGRDHHAWVVWVLTVGLPLLPAFHPRMANEQYGPTVVRQLEPPGFLALHYGARTPISIIVAHLIFGAILGSFYSLR